MEETASPWQERKWAAGTADFRAARYALVPDAVALPRSNQELSPMKLANRIARLLGLQDGEAERAFRDVPVRGQDLVADDVGAGTQGGEGERDAIRGLTAVRDNRQRNRAAVGGGDADPSESLLDLAVEAEIDARRGLGELGVAGRLGLEDDGVGRLAHARHVDDGEADHIAPLLEEEGVAEGETVHDLDLLAHVHAAVEGVGDAPHPLHGRLLLRLLQRGVASDAQPGLGGAGGLDDLASVHGLARDHHEPLGPVAELLIEPEVLRAVRVRGDALQRRLVLVEEALAGGEELLADVLVLVVGEDGHRPHQPEGPPHDGEGCSHDLAVAFLGDEASPRLHEPAVVHVLGAVEDLPRARAHLALEEIAEGLLEDVTHLAEIALADAPDLD